VDGDRRAGEVAAAAIAAAVAVAAAVATAVAVPRLEVVELRVDRRLLGVGRRARRAAAVLVPAVGVAVGRRLDLRQLERLVLARGRTTCAGQAGAKQHDRKSLQVPHPALQVGDESYSGGAP